MATFSRILVATDFSEASRDALGLARAIAHDSSAHLTVLHACEVPAYDVSVPVVDFVTPLVQLAESKLEELLRSMRAEFPDVKGVVKVGVPWEQILSVAAEIGPDLVVLGTHGRRGVAHAIMGSVAEHVVRLSTVPVLTVRARTAK